MKGELPYLTHICLATECDVARDLDTCAHDHVPAFPPSSCLHKDTRTYQRVSRVSWGLPGAQPLELTEEQLEFPRESPVGQMLTQSTQEGVTLMWVPRGCQGGLSKVLNKTMSTARIREQGRAHGAHTPPRESLRFTME